MYVYTWIIMDTSVCVSTFGITSQDETGASVGPEVGVFSPGVSRRSPRNSKKNDLQMEDTDINMGDLHTILRKTMVIDISKLW